MIDSKQWKHFRNKLDELCEVKWMKLAPAFILKKITHQYIFQISDTTNRSAIIHLLPSFL